MSESVSLPALGESVTEGTITRWLKQVGERVEVDEPLLEVSTDKVDTEIPSPVAGVIEQILVAEDETVEVGTALVTIGDGKDASQEPSGSGTADAAETAAHDDTEAQSAPSPEDEADTSEPEPSAQDDGREAASSGTGDVVSDDIPAPDVPSTDAPVESDPSVPEGHSDTTQDQSVDEQSTHERPAQAEDEATQPEQPAEAAVQMEATADADAPVQSETPTQSQESNAPAGAEDGPAASPDERNDGQSSQTSSQPEPGAGSADQSDEVSSMAPALDETPATTSGTDASGTAPSPDVQAGYVTPLVRKLAHERGVDIAALSGTGVGGRIRKQDVVDAAPPTSQAETSAPAAVQPSAREVSELRGTTVPMSRLRKVIAERAVISMQSSAQLTSVVEVDVTRVANLRNRVKDDFLSKTGNKLSFLPFFALAATEALAAYPIINATIDNDQIVYPPHENIAIAVDTERGLLTPVIREASELDLAGFAAQIADLATRTRENKLKPDELAGGTFTLTNTGSRGALFDTPIVFLPQSAILGTGIVVKKPVIVSDGTSDAIAIRSMVYLALSYDHRIVDGADAARFLVSVKDRLEAGAFESNLGI